MKIINWSSEKLGTHQILLDDDDFEKFGVYSWTVEKPTNGSTFYAKRKYTYALNKRKSVAMHRDILGITDPTILIDHIDGNGLNNQRGNLRIATHQQNTQNGGKQKNNTTGYKGVSVKRDGNLITYQSSLGIRTPNGRKNIYGGRFKTPEEAAIKYNELARIHHGEFAYQNPI